MANSEPVAVSLVDVASRPIAAIRTASTLEELPDTIVRLLDQVWSQLRARGIQRTGQNVVVYHAGPADIEVGVETFAPIGLKGRARMSATPGGRAAHAVHWGSYASLRETHAEILEWSAKEGSRLAGPAWEVYGDWSEDLAKLRTDVFYLLEGGSLDRFGHPIEGVTRDFRRTR